MVSPHRPARPEPIVVKPARRRSILRQDSPHCVVCGAELRGDHCLGDLVCDCHPTSGYNPRHDAHLDERVLVLLWRARGQPVNLYRALGCDPFEENYRAVKESVCRLRASGIVRIVGAGRAGRKLAPISPGTSGRVGA